MDIVARVAVEQRVNIMLNQSYDGDQASMQFPNSGIILQNYLWLILCFLIQSAVGLKYLDQINECYIREKRLPESVIWHALETCGEILDHFRVIRFKQLTVWHLEGGRLPADTEDDFLFHDACVHVAEEQDAPQIQIKVEALKPWDKQITWGLYQTNWCTIKNHFFVAFIKCLYPYK